MKDIKELNNVNGRRIRKAVIASGFTKEQVVASVQDKGLRFSLAGLDKIYRNELPVNDTSDILGAIALKCGCLISDFTESNEIKTA
jgi:hypothetical protein